MAIMVEKMHLLRAGNGSWLKGTVDRRAGEGGPVIGKVDVDYGSINENRGIAFKDLDRKIQATSITSLFDAAYAKDIKQGIYDPKSVAKYLSSTPQWSYGAGSNYDSFSDKFFRSFARQFGGLSLEEQKAILNDEVLKADNALLSAELKNPSSYSGYEPTGNDTYCNQFLFEKFVKTDIRIAAALFPNGLGLASQMQDDLFSSSLASVIAMADVEDYKKNKGAIVLGSLKQTGWSHIAFAFPKGTSFFNPSGYNGVQPLGNGYGYMRGGSFVAEKMGKTWPVMAGAGDWANYGITNMSNCFGPDAVDSVVFFALGWKK